MARKKYVPPYKKCDEVLKTLVSAHDMIVSCHDKLEEIEVSQNTMDTLGFALKCLKTGINQIETEKLLKEREWTDFTSRFKVVSVSEQVSEKVN